MIEPADEEVPRVKAKAPWVRPTLTVLGDVKDLVRGASKQSGLAEADPTGIRRSSLG